MWVPISCLVRESQTRKGASGTGRKKTHTHTSQMHRQEKPIQLNVEQVESIEKGNQLGKQVELPIQSNDNLHAKNIDQS